MPGADFRTLDPQALSPVETQKLLTAGVAPRPIALVSTISMQEVPNMAPFSFFNAFGSNPPMVGFSPARRGRDGSLKDTYRNIMATRECVIHAVTFDMLEQMNLTSVDWPSDVSEVDKSGFDMVEADVVLPQRILVSPFAMECRLKDMIHLGEDPGSGNLALCEVVKFHIREDLCMDTGYAIDAFDHIGRNGGAAYTRAHGAALFDAPLPREVLGMGYDGLPDWVRKHKTLTANDIALLAQVPEVPSEQNVQSHWDSLDALKGDSRAFLAELDKGSIDQAWKIAKHLNENAAWTENLSLALARAELSKRNRDKAWMAMLSAK